MAITPVGNQSSFPLINLILYFMTLPTRWESVFIPLDKLGVRQHDTNKVLGISLHSP